MDNTKIVSAGKLTLELDDGTIITGRVINGEFSVDYGYEDIYVDEWYNPLKRYKTSARYRLEVHFDPNQSVTFTDTLAQTDPVAYRRKYVRKNS